MTVSVPDTIQPGGAFPVALSPDIARPNGSSVEGSLAANEAGIVDVGNRVSLDFTNPDVLLMVSDLLRGVLAQFDQEGTLSAKFALGEAKNGLAVRQRRDGSYGIELGSIEGEQPLSDWTALSSFYNPDVSTYFLTADRRVEFEIRAGANSLYAPLTPAASGGGIGDWLQATDFYNPDVEIYFSTKDGRVLLERGNGSLPSFDRELLNARGTARSIDARLSGTMRADGTTTSVIYGRDHLRITPARLSQLRSGVAGMVMSIALSGDSWTDNNYWVPIFTAWARAEYGDAGDGFIPALRGGASGVKEEVLMAYGTFTGINSANGGPAAPGAALSGWTSSDTTTPFKVVYTPSKEQHTAFLHAVGNGAQVRYRKNTVGAWTTITLTGAPLRVDELAADGAFTKIEVELVAGTVTIAGIECRRNGPGVRIHNLGAGSSTMADTLACNEADYVTSLAALAPHLVMMGFGTNEAGRNHSVDTFVANMTAMVARFRAAAPLGDLALWSPAQSLDGSNASLMPLYMEKTRTYASQQGIAHIDGQLLFGRDPSRYGDSGLQFMGSGGEGGGDLYHPTQRGAHRLFSSIKSLVKE